MVGDSNLWFEHSNFAKRDLSFLEVIVMLEWEISWVELVVRGTVVLFETCEFLSHLHLALKHSTEVPSGKDTVVRNGMIEWCWLVIMEVLETGSI